MEDIKTLKVLRLSDTEDQVAALEEIFSALRAERLPEDVIGAIEGAVIAREETSSTYLKENLAVPHARIRGIDSAIIVVGANARGVDWPTPDDKARLVALIAVPEGMITGYLKILQKFLKWRKASGLVAKDGSVKDLPALEAELKAALM